MTRVNPNEIETKKDIKPMHCSACGYKTTFTGDDLIPVGAPKMVPLGNGKVMATPVKIVRGVELPMYEGDCQPFIFLGAVAARFNGITNIGLYACPNCGTVQIDKPKK